MAGLKLRSLVCAAVLTGAGAGLVACESPTPPPPEPVITRGPETLPAAAVLNAETRGEAIDVFEDVDEFTFETTAGSEFNVFFQSHATLVLQLVSREGTVLAQRLSQDFYDDPADTTLFTRNFGRVRVETSGTHIVRVAEAARGGPTSNAIGPYRFFLYQIDRRPEHAPATIASGDTITTEELGLIGDVDEFEFEAAVGDEFNALFQTLSERPDNDLMLFVVDGAGTPRAPIHSYPWDTGFVVTGRFRVETAGTQRLRVLGERGFENAPYRIALIKISRTPESSPDRLAFGDSLFSEAIDVPGDVDEFYVTLPESSGVNVVMQLPSNRPDIQASIEVRDSMGVLLGYEGRRTRMYLAPGTYKVVVDGSGSGGGSVAGLYDIWFYRFRLGPEVAADTIAIGDTVSAETLDPLGDEDVFTFHGTARQHIDVAFQGQAFGSSGGFQVRLLRSGTMDWLAVVYSPGVAGSLEDHRTLRVDLPVTGWYAISVIGAGALHGPYRLGLTPVETGPETAGGALSPGDSVTSEAIDTPGDWDQYTVTATPGEELGLVFHSTGSLETEFPRILALDPSSGDSLAGTVGQFVRFAGPLRVPSSGTLTVAVFEPQPNLTRWCDDSACNGIFRFVGGYGFHVIRVYRAPEAVSPTYAVGDTVRGEAIAPIGDFDEFTSSGTSGETLTLYARLTASPSNGTGISVEIIDPVTGGILAGQNTFLTVANQQFFSLGSFTVPSSGAFLIRVRGSSTYGEGIATAPYEFFVKR